MNSEFYMRILGEFLWEIGIFVAIFAESVPFIGALIPGGAIILFLAGFYSRFGSLNIYVTWLVCFLASYSIDLFGYYVGKRWGNKWISKYSKYFMIRECFIHKLADILKKHAVKGLVIGKFNPATRSMGPFVAGMKELEYQKFNKISLLASALWVTFFVWIGYFVGSGVEKISLYGKIAIVLTICGFLFLYFTYLIIHKLREKKYKE